MKTCKQLYEDNILNNDTRFASISIYNQKDLDDVVVGNTMLEIHMEPNEDNVPHININIQDGTKNNNICHLKLLSNEYLRDENDVMNRLNKQERFVLNEYLHREIPGFSGKTIWFQFLMQWNIFNPSKAIDSINIKKCPDYTNIKEEMHLIDEDNLFQFARFSKERSGLLYDIWIDNVGKDRESKDNLPIIKVQDTKDKNNFISVLIGKEPKILGEEDKSIDNIYDVVSFIKSNYSDLLKVWNKEEDSFWFIKKHSKNDY